MITGGRGPCASIQQYLDASKLFFFKELFNILFHLLLLLMYHRNYFPKMLITAGLKEYLQNTVMLFPTVPHYKSPGESQGFAFVECEMSTRSRSYWGRSRPSVKIGKRQRSCSEDAECLAPKLEILKMAQKDNNKKEASEVCEEGISWWSRG